MCGSCNLHRIYDREKIWTIFFTLSIKSTLSRNLSQHQHLPPYVLNSLVAIDILMPVHLFFHTAICFQRWHESTRSLNFYLLILKFHELLILFLWVKSLEKREGGGDETGWIRKCQSTGPNKTVKKTQSITHLRTLKKMGGKNNNLINNHIQYEYI